MANTALNKFRLSPMKETGVNEMITPIYEKSQIIEGSIDSAKEAATKLLDSSDEIVQVDITKLGATALKSKKMFVVDKDGIRKYAEGGGVGIELSTSEIERLDVLQKKEDLNELTESENSEYEALVEKYRETDTYKKNQSEQYAKGGTIDSDTAIMPEIVADVIASERVANKFKAELEGWDKLNKKEKDALNKKVASETAKLTEELAEKAETIYKHNAEFKKGVNAKGNKGRDYLYIFMNHWADAYSKGLPVIRKEDKFEDGGEVEEFTKNLGQVEVIFENPEYNYVTNVNGSITEEEARKYFVGKELNIEPFPSEKTAKVVDIKFAAKGAYAEGGVIEATDWELIHDELFFNWDDNEEFPAQVYYSPSKDVFKSVNDKTGVEFWKPRTLTSEVKEKIANYVGVSRSEISKSDIFMANEVDKVNHFAQGGEVGDLGKEGMKHALTQWVSSGMIANATSVSDYKSVDEIRFTAIQMLNRDGDKPYSLGALTELLKEAEAEWKENKHEATFADGGKVERESITVKSLESAEAMKKTMQDIAKLKNVVIKKGKKQFNPLLETSHWQEYIVEWDKKVPDSGAVEFADGGAVEEKATITVKHPTNEQYDDVLYLTKSDFTHVFLSNNPSSKGSPYHIGQLRDEQYYNDLEKWLSGKMDINGKVYQSVRYDDGGAVDYGVGEEFNKKMAALQNKQDVIRGEVKMAALKAVGLDRAHQVLTKDWVINPYSLIERAVSSDLIDLKKEFNEEVFNAAVSEAEEVNERYRDSGQGISSSDSTAFLMNFLNDAGLKATFVNSRLQRVNSAGEVVIIKNELPEVAFHFAKGGGVSKIESPFGIYGSGGEYYIYDNVRNSTVPSSSVSHWTGKMNSFPSKKEAVEMRRKMMLAMHKEQPAYNLHPDEYKYAEGGTVEEYSKAIKYGQNDVNSKILSISELPRVKNFDGKIYELVASEMYTNDAEALAKKLISEGYDAKAVDQSYRYLDKHPFWNQMKRTGIVGAVYRSVEKMADGGTIDDRSFNVYKLKTPSGVYYDIVDKKESSGGGDGSVEKYYKLLATNKDGRKFLPNTYLTSIEKYSTWDKINFSDLPASLQKDYNENWNHFIYADGGTIDDTEWELINDALFFNWDDNEEHPAQVFYSKAKNTYKSINDKTGVEFWKPKELTAADKSEIAEYVGVKESEITPADIFLANKVEKINHLADGGEVAGTLKYKKGDTVFVFQHHSKPENWSHKPTKLELAEYKAVADKYVIEGGKNVRQKWSKVKILEPISDERGNERYRVKQLDGYRKENLFVAYQSSMSPSNAEPISIGYMESGGGVDDDNDDDLMLEYIGTLIKDGNTSGYEPAWTLKINFDGEIDDLDREYIGKKVSEGYTSGEIVSGEEEKTGWWNIEIDGGKFAYGGSIQRSTDKALRPSPSVSATVYSAGYEMEGNDGNTWVISIASNGVHRWVKQKGQGGSHSGYSMPAQSQKPVSRSADVQFADGGWVGDKDRTQLKSKLFFVNDTARNRSGDVVSVELKPYSNNKVDKMYVFLNSVIFYGKHNTPIDEIKNTESDSNEELSKDIEKRLTDYYNKKNKFSDGGEAEPSVGWEVNPNAVPDDVYWALEAMDRRFIDTLITIKKKGKSDFVITNEEGLTLGIEDHDDGTNEKKVFDWLKQTTKAKIGVYEDGGSVGDKVVLTEDFKNMRGKIYEAGTEFEVSHKASEKGQVMVKNPTIEGNSFSIPASKVKVKSSEVEFADGGEVNSFPKSDLEKLFKVKSIINWKHRHPDRWKTYFDIWDELTLSGRKEAIKKHLNFPSKLNITDSEIEDISKIDYRTVDYNSLTKNQVLAWNRFIYYAFSPLDIKKYNSVTNDAVEFANGGGVGLGISYDAQTAYMNDKITKQELEEFNKLLRTAPSEFIGYQNMSKKQAKDWDRLEVLKSKIKNSFADGGGVDSLTGKIIQRTKAGEWFWVIGGRVESDSYGYRHRNPLYIVVDIRKKNNRPIATVQTYSDEIIKSGISEGELVSELPEKYKKAYNKLSNEVNLFPEGGGFTVKKGVDVQFAEGGIAGLSDYTEVEQKALATILLRESNGELSPAKSRELAKSYSWVKSEKGDNLDSAAEEILAYYEDEKAEKFKDPILIKVADAINNGKLKILRGGEKMYGKLKLSITELVWARNFEDGFRISVYDEAKNHIGDIDLTASTNFKPVIKPIFADGGSVDVYYQVRKDLLKKKESVPVGSDYVLEGKWKGRYTNDDETFEIFHNGKWQEAESIDFEYINPDKKEDGGSVTEAREFNYLKLEPVKGGLKISLTKEGQEKANDDGLDFTNFWEYFEDVQGNSEYNFLEDGGSGGFGLTEAPMIIDGYYVDDDGSYVTDYPKSAKVYYFGDYMIKDFAEVLESQGEIIFSESN